MEAYARIYQIGLTSNDTDQEQRIDQHVKALIIMANKEKYSSYRSIIYAAAAEMEMKRKNIPNAISFLLKSNQYNTTDSDVRNAANLNIASLAFSTKQYELAKNIMTASTLAAKKILKKSQGKKTLPMHFPKH